MTEKRCAQCGRLFTGAGKSFCDVLCWKRSRTERARPVLDRITEKLGVADANGCIPWLAANTRGYGVLTVRTPKGKRASLVTRLLWAELRGPLSDGTILRHKCDNPACCNLEHLETGTMLDNTQDMMSRGRHGLVYGEENGRHKVTEVEVREIRRLSGAGVRNLVIADRFGICERQVWMLVSRRSWKRVA